MTQNMRTTCYRCYRPQPHCLCSHITEHDNQTHFVFLMHPKEAKKQRLGTGRMSYASLKNSTIIVEENPDDSETFRDMLSEESNDCYLLYPGDDALILGTNQGRALGEKIKRHRKDLVFFILDATWPCAKKMMRLSHQLKDMNKVTFPAVHRSEFLIKHQPDIACLSTIESVFHTLNYLNDDGIEDLETTRFLDPFHAMIAFQQKCASDPTIPSNRGQKREGVVKEQRVRPKTHRLFFWDVNKSHVGQRKLP